MKERRERKETGGGNRCCRHQSGALKKSVPAAPAAAPLPIQTHYSEKAHSLMASVVGSPRRGPVTASPDDTQEHGSREFSKKWFALGLQREEGGADT